MSEEPRSSIEVTGPDVDTAVANGLKQLGVSSSDVIVEVLEEPSRGFLGIGGGRKARVRLTLLAPPSPPSQPEPPAPAAAPAEAPAEQPPREKPAEHAPREQRDRDKGGSRGGKSQRRDSGRDSARESTRDRRPAPAHDDEGDEDEDAFISDEQLTPVNLDENDDARVAYETLNELLGHMHIQAQIEAFHGLPMDEEETPPIILQVTGRDLGMLIGRKGETLSSLQYITRLIASRDLQRRADVVVDVEGYKARREKRLRSLALRMASQVSRRGRTIALEPMPAYERRIIHLTLRDRTDVFTRSVGEGASRKVTIVPVRDR